VGTGVAGTMAETLDTQRRAKAKEQRATWIALRSRLEAAERLTNKFGGTMDVLVQTALDQAGYRQHHRGQWRKHRAKSVGQIRQGRNIEH